MNNITVSRLQADWLVANNSLTVGAVYRIFDNANYEYIVLTAATSNTFNPRVLVYAPRPLYRGVATVYDRRRKRFLQGMLGVSYTDEDISAW